MLCLYMNTETLVTNTSRKRSILLIKKIPKIQKIKCLVLKISGF